MTTPRWQRRKSEAVHTDDWLMTYADMITLLLCFFAIVIIVSVPKRNVQPKTQFPPIVEQVAQTPLAVSPQIPTEAPPIKTMDIFPGNLPFHPIQDSDFAHDTPSQPVNNDQPTDAPTVKADDQPPVPVIQIALPAIQIVLPEAKAPPIPPPEQKGDRITTLDMNSAAFFDSGSAVLSKSGMAILEKVAVSLKSEQFKNYQITVEGHTDDTPIHTEQFPSNWELSTARASAVVHYFLDQGIPATRLRAAGYADTFPKAPNRDEHGNPIPANQAENRRVVIKLEKIEKN